MAGESISRGLKILNSIVGFVTMATVIGGAWYFYKSNIWRPTIKVLSVDYLNGKASLNINGTTTNLYKNQVLRAGADWGIRFNGDTPDNLSRIELYKNHLVYSVIDNKAA